LDSPVSGQEGEFLSIAAVERDTGLPKDTLRVWERRYGFPQPGRDALGERTYPREQVDKLRLLKRLMDAGHRPGKLVGRDIGELRALAEAPAAEAPHSATPPGYWELLKTHDVSGVRRQLQQALLGLGLERFVIEHVAPLNRAVGEGWLRGELSVAQEHIYSEALQLVLRQAIGNVAAPPADAPRVLMATLPQEGHGLGLLMAEAMLSLHGWRCLSLGVKVPMDELITVARLVEADIVALSFSDSFRPAQAAEALAELRRRLPARTRIWAGGGSLARPRHLPPGVEAVPDIALIPALVERWRQAPVMPPN
jgi:methanogenic corrinoid protein MtbC1